MSQCLLLVDENHGSSRGECPVGRWRRRSWAVVSMVVMTVHWDVDISTGARVRTGCFEDVPLPAAGPGCQAGR